jgi:uncharacterized membrane protein
MFTLPIMSAGSATMTEWIEIASLVIEILAVAIIVGSVFYSSTRFIYFLVSKRRPFEDNYLSYKHSLGKSLLLGLEILVAADVVRTVALEPTVENILALGLLVVVRTFLSWSLVVEIEGRWPWQPKRVIPE